MPQEVDSAPSQGRDGRKKKKNVKFASTVTLRNHPHSKRSADTGGGSSNTIVTHGDDEEEDEEKFKRNKSDGNEFYREQVKQMRRVLLDLDFYNFKRWFKLLYELDKDDRGQLSCHPISECIFSAACTEYSEIASKMPEFNPVSIDKEKRAQIRESVNVMLKVHYEQCHHFDRIVEENKRQVMEELERQKDKKERPNKKNEGSQKDTNDANY